MAAVDPKPIQGKNTPVHDRAIYKYCFKEFSREESVRRYSWLASFSLRVQGLILI